MWVREYDQTLKEHYYLNSEDNSISFDLPCEVLHRKLEKSIFSRPRKQRCLFKNGKSDNEQGTELSKKNSNNSVFSKLSKKLSRKSSATGSVKDLEKEYVSAPVSPVSPLFSHNDDASYISGLDEDFLVEAPLSYYISKNAYSNSTVASEDEDSIHSIYSEIEMFDGYHYTESVYNFEKEKERLELRQQMRQELGY